ncbi:cysteine-rich receptor-like protein kinase 1 isoform X2 [Vigna radiata var. radiata]|uniref:Cysteine-rich receptor-like protein kinase 1 isoform X2 n=1 Tax=Vigna radiata var. radiata TaxID=3916 RepID=A0A3Q0ESJ6_VIGRR|nr:cysteine-rich receptor-like protein kinase 1 isoform X2 [Vigna radiata var. radiata]
MVQFFNVPENLITWVCLMLLSSSLLIPRAGCSGTGIRETGLTCGDYENPESSASNFMAIMDMVSFQVKERGWGAQTLLGSGPPMYALAQCRRDLRPADCYMCFSQARLVLSRCVPKAAGRIYLEGCFLRYDDYSFIRESVDPTHDIGICVSPTVGNDTARRVAATVSNVTEEAVERGFAVDGGDGVFALAQCWSTLNKGRCKICLTEAAKKVQECVPSGEGKSLFTGCILRYSRHKFYNDVSPPPNIKDSPTSTEEGPGVWTIVAFVLSVIVGISLIVLAACMCCHRMSSRRKGFSFRYDLLENATDHFDPANKLGQGGAASVFKGTLPTGKTVAVKRLSFNKRQWTEGFFNEVNLISGIQHKNVVKLLGCSIEGPESLLVYEFVPNGSLDQVLFGKGSEDALNWEKRFQIICGIAEGLAYLHEGSGTKIIHRDIKSSNILFDENMNPKIADFGLSHIVTGNESHRNAGNSKTLGYTAPEYVSNGQLTEKADIYAFGVLIVEIVCGKKNSDHIAGSTSLLHSVWKNYKANNITASVDPVLQGKLTVEEASNTLQAGLLCTQSTVTLRPSMSEVVQMLTKKDYTIPSPKQQPFLNFSGLSQNDRTVSSIGLASARSSFHSTTSSLIPNDDLTVQRNSSSHSDKFIAGSPDSNIQLNMGAPEPR